MKEVAYSGILIFFYLAAAVVSALIIALCQVLKSAGKKKLSSKSKLMVVAASLVWPISLPIQLFHMRWVVRRGLKAEAEKEKEMIDKVAEVTGADEDEAEEIVDAFKELGRSDKK